jgi:hypothetical protein
MARKPTENESRKETISYRVTRSMYAKIINCVDKSNEPCLSDYARTALIERMQREEKKDNVE